jgi:hypothetical protein
MEKHRLFFLILLGISTLAMEIYGLSDLLNWGIPLPKGWNPTATIIALAIIALGSMCAVLWKWDDDELRQNHIS